MDILIVDDDQEDLELYIELFDSIDHNLRILNFTEPEKALTHLQQSGQLPDLIVLDYNMPRMTGLEFLTLFRAELRFRHTRVIVITTGCSSHETEALRKLNTACYQKPSTVNEFRTLLQSILESTQA